MQTERRQTEALVAVMTALAQARTLADVGEAVVSVAAAELGAKAAGLFLYHRDSGELELIASRGYAPDLVERWTRFPISADVPAAEAVRERRPQRRMGPGPLVSLPMLVRGEAFGAITFNLPEDDRFGPEHEEFLTAFALHCAQAVDRALLDEAEQEARLALEEAEARLRILSEASRALASSLDLDAILGQVADLAVEHLADSAIVYLADEQGHLHSAAMAHADPVRLDLLERFDELYEPSEPEASHVARAFRTRVPQEIAEIDVDAFAGVAGPEVAEVLRGIGSGSGLALPLVIGSRAVGVLALAWTGTRSVGPGDLALGEEVARRMARAIENARLYQAERTAVATAERAWDRLRLVSRASELLSASLDYATAFERLARLVAEEMADLCLIDVLEDGRINRVAAVHADPKKQHLADRLRDQYPPALEGQHPVAGVLRSGTPEHAAEMPEELLRATTRDEEHFSIVRQLGFQSFMCVPLSAVPGILGTITFVSCDPSHRYGEEDLFLALEIARRAAARIDNARLFTERDHIARSLQQILLPPSLPEIAGFELAATYQAGRPGMEVGGDFYDVFLRPDGSFGIAIGDVCGNGPDAAAVMGVARQSIRVAGMSETRPSAILGLLNEALLRGDYDRFVTVCDVRVRPGEDVARLTVCSAGHPLPLLVSPCGDVKSVGRPGTLLGVFEDVVLTDVTFELPPGGALLLYTDGLVEKSSRLRAQASLERLLSALAGRSAGEMLEAIEEWWREGNGATARDDAAGLVLRATAKGAGIRGSSLRR
jgi:GAF domain-containing protein